MKLRERIGGSLRVYGGCGLAKHTHFFDTEIERMAGNFKNDVGNCYFIDRMTMLIDTLPDDETVLEKVLMRRYCNVGSCIRCDNISDYVAAELLKKKKNIPKLLRLEWLCKFGKKDELFKEIEESDNISTIIFSYIINYEWIDEYMEKYKKPIISNSSTPTALYSCKTAKILDYYLQHFDLAEIDISLIVDYVRYRHGDPTDIVVVLIKKFPYLGDHFELDDNDTEIIQKMINCGIPLDNKIYYSNKNMRIQLLQENWHRIQYFSEEYKTDDILMLCVKKILNLPLFE